MAEYGLEPKQKERVQKKKKGKNPFIVWNPPAQLKKNINEALSVQQRRKLAQRMIRMARQMEVARKKAAARFASNKNLRMRAQKLVRSIFRTRLAGQRGKSYRTLGMADKIAIDKMVDKQKPALKKFVNRVMPAVKRAEATRLSKAHRASSDSPNDPRHKKKFQGR
jgi:hypothetical protein